MQKSNFTALLFSALLAIGGIGLAQAADDNASSPPSATPPAPTTNTPSPYYGGPGNMGPSQMGPGMMSPYGSRPAAPSGGQGYGEGYPGPGYGPYHPYGRGGYGMGSGRGYAPHMGAMGPGMGGMGSGMSLGAIWALDLSAKQRKAISDLMQEQQKANWQRMTEMMTDSAKLQKLYGTEKWDADAIGQVYADIFKLRREGIVSMIKLRNKILGELTDAQRKQLREGYGWR